VEYGRPPAGKGAEIIQRYQDHILRDIAVDEIQADEIRTFVDNKRIDRYIITALIVQCRLWMSDESIDLPSRSRSIDVITTSFVRTEH